MFIFHYNVYVIYLLLLFLVVFFVTEKNYLMSSLAMSVRPSSVEITLECGSNRSAELIDLKIGLNMGN